MAEIPETSETLLRAIGGDSGHARWGEFVARYRPMMEAYLQSRFPTLDADELIQETFIALVKILPRYRWSPDEKGAFRNYLTGILRRRALKMLAREKRRAEVQRDLAQAEPSASGPAERDEEERGWREAVYAVALRLYLADETVQERTKEVFRRVALQGEPPESVASAFGIARNAVDQIKNRAVRRLRELVEALRKAGE